MATYANSQGRNKGKKYIKLRGDEVATPANEARAAEFLVWYADNMARLRNMVVTRYEYDEDIATDTALKVYDIIALKGYEVRDYAGYFCRAYFTNYLKAQSGFSHISLSEFYRRYEVLDNFAAPLIDYTEYERAADKLQFDIIEYVRAKYSPVECSLFEIYAALQPSMSYKKMAEMLGWSAYNIWVIIGAIKKDIKGSFAARRDNILSLL